jgi:hypothetical protein
MPVEHHYAYIVPYVIWCLVWLKHTNRSLVKSREEAINNCNIWNNWFITIMLPFGFCQIDVVLFEKRLPYNNSNKSYNIIYTYYVYIYTYLLHNYQMQMWSNQFKQYFKVILWVNILLNHKDMSIFYEEWPPITILTFPTKRICRCRQHIQGSNSRGSTEDRR